MNSAASQANVDPSRVADRTVEGRRRRKSPWVIAAVVLVVAGAAVAITDPFSSRGPSHPGVADNADPTSLATVTRQDLSSQTQVPASLGYADSYTIVNQAPGTVTAVPEVGQVVSEGQVLYQMSGEPVVLLYGSTPAYRALSEGVTGADVAELNADLVALGYATSTEIPSGAADFTYRTEVGVEKLQAALGVTENGTLSLGQAMFEPTTVRVTSVSATLGAPAQPGQPVVSATSTSRQVSIALDAAQQSEVKDGDKVAITLPNNQTTPGLVASVGTVATTASSSSSPTSPSSSGSGNSGSSNPTITVLVTPTEPAATGSWDQAPVYVAITTASVSNALAVPVNALVALSGGGYSVEVVGTDGIHHLVPVSLGLFGDADGLVQVTGAGLAAGQHVVVPGS